MESRRVFFVAHLKHHGEFPRLEDKSSETQRDFFFQGWFVETGIDKSKQSILVWIKLDANARSTNDIVTQCNVMFIVQSNLHVIYVYFKIL